MTLIHDDGGFDDLIRIVAQERKLAPGLIEKDYWVTHTLWAIHAAGFEVWFKGGTSLSKGFGLIERFSEDLDLKVEPGSMTALPTVSSWKSEGTKGTRARKGYFEKLAELLSVPGAQVALDPDFIDPTWRSANLRVTYAGRHGSDLGVMLPFVRLEVGSARVTPFVPRDMTSFLHEKLASLRQLDAFEDNRPKAVRCVHPMVTLIEKLDALHRRVPNKNVAPATFVRHFEDAAHVIGATGRLPRLTDYVGPRALADEMLAQRQIAALPNSMDPAFAPAHEPRWDEIQEAHAAIDAMFWGPRIPLKDACAAIRTWTSKIFG